MEPEAVETDLLAAIVAEPDAIEPRLIYGDWLQSRNDPRGELIVVQAGRVEKPDDVELEQREKELVKQLTDTLILQTAADPLATGMIARWHLGFIDMLELDVRTIRLLRSTHRDWFAQPVFRVVREIDLQTKFARNLRFVRDTPLGDTVRALRFGDVHALMDEPTLEAITARMPNITSLHLRNSDVPTTWAPLRPLPLRTLTIDVRGVTNASLGRLEQIPWKLETFAFKCLLAIPEDMYPSLSPLYDGTVLGTVKHFHVNGTVPVMETVEFMAASKRAATVETFTGEFQRIPYGGQERATRYRDQLKSTKFFPTLGQGDWTDAENCVSTAGFLNYRLERPAEALPIYKQALRIKADHSNARHNLGICLRKLKRMDESLVEFDTIINQSRSPTASMFNGRHYTLCELRRHEEARADLERAVQIDANFADAWNNLGCERQYIGDSEGALAAFRRCMQVDAEHGYARRNEADLLLEIGLAGEALPIYHELLARKPGDGNILAMMAHAQVESGDPAAARATLDGRLGVEEQYRTRLQVLRALALQDLGDHAAARRDLDTAANETDCPAWYAMTVYVRCLGERALWSNVVPDSAITSRQIADAFIAYGKTARSAKATAFHDASTDDLMDCSEIAVAAALLAKNRDLAVHRARTVAALYVEQGPRFHRKWWQTLGTAIAVTNRNLGEEARSLLRLTVRTVRGRARVAELMAIVE